MPAVRVATLNMQQVSRLLPNTVAAAVLPIARAALLMRSRTQTCVCCHDTGWLLIAAATGDCHSGNSSGQLPALCCAARKPFSNHFSGYLGAPSIDGTPDHRGCVCCALLPLD